MLRSAKKCQFIQNVFSLGFAVILHKKEMVVAINASMYHVNSSIFAPTTGAGQTGFLLVLHPKS